MHLTSCIPQCILEPFRRLSSVALSLICRSICHPFVVLLPSVLECLFHRHFVVVSSPVSSSFCRPFCRPFAAQFAVLLVSVCRPFRRPFAICIVVVSSSVLAARFAVLLASVLPSISLSVCRLYRRRFVIRFVVLCRPFCRLFPRLCAVRFVVRFVVVCCQFCHPFNRILGAINECRLCRCVEYYPVERKPYSPIFAQHLQGPWIK